MHGVAPLNQEQIGLIVKIFPLKNANKATFINNKNSITEAQARALPTKFS